MPRMFGPSRGRHGHLAVMFDLENPVRAGRDFDPARRGDAGLKLVLAHHERLDTATRPKIESLACASHQVRRPRIRTYCGLLFPSSAAPKSNGPSGARRSRHFVCHAQGTER